MVKRVTVLINSFRRKSGVHSVMVPRKILFGKKFKTPLCKIGEVVMVYNVTASNKTTHPRAFYALYIGPNDSGTGHIAFKLSTKQLVTTHIYKPVPMPEDVITAVNEIGRQEGMPEGIQFHNIHHESTLLDLFVDKDLNDNDSCASDIDWNMEKNPEVDLKKLVTNIAIDNNQVADLNNEDALHLNDGLADDNNADNEDIGVVHK